MRCNWNLTHSDPQGVSFVCNSPRLPRIDITSLRDSKTFFMRHLCKFGPCLTSWSRLEFISHFGGNNKECVHFWGNNLRLHDCVYRIHSIPSQNMVLVHSDNVNIDLRKADRVAEQTLLHLMGGVILDKMGAHTLTITSFRQFFC